MSTTTENGQLTTLRDLAEYIRNDGAHTAALQEIESVEQQLAALRKAAEAAEAQLSKFMREGAPVEDYPIIVQLREALLKEG